MGRGRGLQGGEEADIRRGGEGQTAGDPTLLLRWWWAEGANADGKMDDWIDHREDKYASEYLCGGA